MSREAFWRRNLPHWCQSGCFHFVTFRLAGTIPQDALATIHRSYEQRLKRGPAPGQSVREFRTDLHKRFFALYDQYLDQHREMDWLSDPVVASMLRESLYHLHGKLYELRCFCIMPNHVHVLFIPFALTPVAGGELETASFGESNDKKSPLSRIMHSLKGYSAHRANKILGRSGSFWQHESYDHLVRDEEELERIVAYINANPVKARLVERATDWIWGSAHDRFSRDGDSSGWLRWEENDERERR